MYKVRVKCQSNWSSPGPLDTGSALVYDAVSPRVSILSNDKRPSHKSHRIEKKVSRGCCNTKNWNWAMCEPAGTVGQGTGDCVSQSQTCLGQWPTQKRVQTNLIIVVRLCVDTY